MRGRGKGREKFSGEKSDDLKEHKKEKGKEMVEGMRVTNEEKKTDMPIKGGQTQT